MGGSLTFDKVENAVERILPVVHSPFREVMDILSQDHPPNGTLAHILSSSCSPLYTALILLTPTCKFPIIHPS